SPAAFSRHLPTQQGPGGTTEYDTIRPAFRCEIQTALECEQRYREGKRCGQSRTAERPQTDDHRAIAQGRGQANGKRIVADNRKKPVNDDGIERRRGVVEGDDVRGTGELRQIKSEELVEPQFGLKVSRDRTGQK